MPLLVVLALIVVPIVELYVIVQVGQGIGVLPTIALLIVMSLLGGYLLRREGTRTWRALRDALQAGRLPAREVADGALVILGGALLLTPGFATDAFGLLFILPPSRAVLRRLLTGVVAKRLGVAGMVGGVAADRLRRPSRPGARDPRRHDVVEGEVVEDGVADEGPPSPP
ncbi:MAG: FxsA cytoplasmic rane protein [Frankiales bacterium]|nr:FxsA cytoplasmic rane protein [Frankiales bacterium]